MDKYVLYTIKDNIKLYNRVFPDNTKTDSSKWIQNYINENVIFKSKEQIEARLKSKKFGIWKIEKVRGE